MKILFLSRWFPWPPDNGAKIRVYNLLRFLASHHQVDLISFTDEAISKNRIDALMEFCDHVNIVPYRTFQPRRLKALLGFISPYPRSVVDTSSQEMYAVINSHIQRQCYDVVIASELDMILYAQAIPRSKADLRILEELEISNLYGSIGSNGNPINKLRHDLMRKKWQKYLVHQLADFDAFTVASHRELQEIENNLGKYISIPRFVIPNGVDLNRYQGIYPPPQEDTLIYSGALSYSANFDAVAFFLQNIMPFIAAQRPAIKLMVTGKTEGIPLEKLPASKHVTFTGYLEDIRPAIAQSWASIVPLRHGGGTRLKILEALAIGTPVIATPKGAEGLELTPGRDILIAGNPTEFAETTLKLLSDPDLRQRLSVNGQQAVQQYDWSIIGEKLISVIEVAASRQHTTQKSQSK